MIAGALYGTGFGGVIPSLQALAVRSVPFHRLGATTGTFYNGFDIVFNLQY